MNSRRTSTNLLCPHYILRLILVFLIIISVMKEHPEKNQGEAFSSIIEEVNLLLRRDQVINMLVYEPDPPYFNDTLMELFY